MIVDILFAILLLAFFLFGLAWYMSNKVISRQSNMGKEDWDQYDLQAETVSFMTLDRIKIVGSYIKGSKYSTIILLHGYGRSKEQMLPQAQFLNKAGYNILMFDFRASGESEGKYITFGHRERRDLDGAIKYLKEREDVDINKLGVLGFSMGGAVALMRSADYPEIKAIVISSTYARFKSIIWQNFKRYLKGFPFFPLGYITLWVIKFRTGISFLQINPIFYLKKLKEKPLFLIHGAHDRKAPIQNAMEIYKKAPWLEQFWFVKHADHDDLYEVNKEEYKEKVLAFFNKHIPD